MHIKIAEVLLKMDETHPKKLIDEALKLLEDMRKKGHKDVEAYAMYEGTSAYGIVSDRVNVATAIVDTIKDLLVIFGVEL